MNCRNKELHEWIANKSFFDWTKGVFYENDNIYRLRKEAYLDSQHLLLVMS